MASSEARLCQADIRTALINPETAQFFEFETINQATFRRGVENLVWKQHNVSRSERGRFGNQLDQPIDEIVRTATERDAQFRSYRVKADSRVGLTVTTNYACAIAEGQCACLVSDE
jgi:hypothetical protein